MQYADDINDPDFGPIRHMDTDRWEGSAALCGNAKIEVVVQGNQHGPSPSCRDVFVTFRDSYHRLKADIESVFRNYGMEGPTPSLLRAVRVEQNRRYNKLCLTAILYMDDSIEEHQYEVEYVDGAIQEIDV